MGKIMLEYVKFQVERLLSSKYIRKGKCKQCGNCCKNIVFYIGKNAVSTKEQFESLKKWSKSYNNFFVTGKDEQGVLLFTCKCLDSNNKCKVYYLRSINCRLYPNPNKIFLANGGKLLDDCGYYFKADKEFKDYLN